MEIQNKFSVAAFSVEIIGIALILLNITGIFSAGFVGLLVLLLSIIGYLKNEKKIYCYLLIIIGIITMISPILIIFIAKPFS